jgi:hypothetical protein
VKRIKQLDDFFDSLSEAFNNPLVIKWIDKSYILRGLFTVNDNIYQIVCEERGNNIWKYDFYFYDKNKNFSPLLTGLEKDKFRVLPTVKIGLQYLYDTKKVEAIVFGASDKSKGRKSLYEDFCEEFSKKNNLEYYTRVYSDLNENIDRQIFVLYKDYIDRVILSETILKILEEEKFGNN